MRMIGIAASAFAVSACVMFGGGEDRAPKLPPSSRSTDVQVPGSPSADARMLGFLNLANKGDFEGGRLAQARASSPAVKNYARQMETDHLRMLEESESAAQTLGIVPVMGPETQPLIRSHEAAMQGLQGVGGPEFDRAYMQHEVEMHRQVLQTAAAMATQIQNSALKTLIANSRPVLEAHLRAAEAVSGQIR